VETAADGGVTDAVFVGAMVVFGVPEVTELADGTGS